MKQLLWTIALVATSVAAYGQRTEFSVQAGSGLFSFRGPGSADETYLSIIEGVMSKPYGRRSDFSYSITSQVQRVTKANFIYGAQMSYESLTSRIAIRANA